MQIVVARKSPINHTERKTIQKIHSNDLCVVLMNTAYFSGLVPKLIKTQKKMSPFPLMSRNIQKVHFEDDDL